MGTYTMKVLRFVAPGQVDLIDEPRPELKPHEVRIKTLYSGISAGTELSAYRGTNPYLTRHWDPKQTLFFPTTDRSPSYPLTGWGYSELGDIIEVGTEVSHLSISDRVWGIWGHRTEAVLPESALIGHTMPKEVDPRAGTFGRVGAVALNAVLSTPIGIGSVVGILGLGVIGLLATRFAVLSGATVIAIDPIEERRNHALAWGASHAFVPSSGVAADIRDLTDKRGADVVIELSGSSAALHEAIRLAGPDATVVASGFYQGGALSLRLGEEFHHNRIHLACSQIGSVPRHLQSRWSRDRLHLSAMERILRGDPPAVDLVTHEFKLEEAARAYELLDQRGSEVLQVLFNMK